MNRLSYFIGGAIAGLAHAPVYFVPGLAAFALLILAAQESTRARQAFWRSWIFGFGYGLTSLYWIGWSFFIEAGRFGPLAIPAIFLLISTLALFPAMAGALIHVLAPRRAWLMVLATALVLAVLEIIRPYLTGFPWNHYASVWAFSAETLQPLRWVGTYGYGFLTLLLALTFGCWLLRKRLELDLSLRAPIALGLCFAVMFTIGIARLPDDAENNGPPTVRLIQPNIDLLTRRSAEGRYTLLDRQTELSLKDVPESIRLVVWPETAIPFDATRDEGARELAAQALGPDMLLVTGSDRFDIESEPVRIWNSVVVITPEAELRGVYDKRHLVPFGEFLPARALLSSVGLKKLTAGSLDFSAGDEHTMLDLPGIGTFAPLICFEVAFPVNISTDKRNPEFIINVTIDTWFGTTSGPYQHLALARMRAVETGLPLLRAANSGISTAFDGYGREIGRLGLNKAGALDIALPQKARSPEWLSAVKFLANIAG